MDGSYQIYDRIVLFSKGFTKLPDLGGRLEVAQGVGGGVVGT